METKMNKKTRTREERSLRPDKGGLTAQTPRTTVAEKTGAAHLTGRISELSIFGLLWG
ncbi:hypothetical protein [Sinomicrobium weinanense]|uniref:Uncharacterized protein n=1 Tax=Sinomicrobium weinanense TaxID=2842200 RepID=A0A926Q2P5_9FLAO|nr:hypothetical protein [Sinomicrobium weinanense]MBC9796852.1 hypothetical protein [Sinomicrobium weinanense]MBU3125225.1 hypothetical protein [Sinomicrobium weinanense]